MTATLRLPRPPLTPRESTALDDAESLMACTHWQVRADGRRVADSAFVVQGMHCAACAGIVEAALRAVPGVLGAEVNASTGRAGVRWDPDRTRASLLVEAVRRAGYGALPAQRADAQAALQAESRQALWRLFVAGFCMMQVMMLAAPAYLAGPGQLAPDLAALLRRCAWMLSLPVLLFSAGPFFGGAWRALRQRRIGMDVPVAIGIAVTFLAGTGAAFDPAGPFGADSYLDSMTMFVAFLLAGRWLETRARARSTEALDALLQRMPDSVDRFLADGGIETVAVARLRVGDRVRVLAGQAFPGDGSVIEGCTEVDEALVSGESRPVARGPGSPVIGGSVNLHAPVVVDLLRVGQGTRYQQIVDLVQRALSERPALLRSADRLAGPFLWAVLLLAALATAVWSVVDPARALWVGVSVLIVTCPCALSLAAPAALLCAAGTLARRGVLVQRLDALEALARTDVVCFDKTGTLTEDRLALATIVTDPGLDAATRARLVGHAASLAAQTRHPLAVALAAALPGSGVRWSELREVAGHGVEGRDPDGRRWRLGAPGWVGVGASPVARPVLACAPAGTAPHESVVFEFDEVLRADARQALDELRTNGVEVRILSGDSPASVAAMATRLGVANAAGGATPERKLEALGAWQRAGHRVLMVGDGLNDGPVLARADASFALAHGSALAQQRADFIVLGSRLAAVPMTRAVARRALRVVHQNLAWAAAYNAVCVPLALFGLLPPWLAAAGMATSSLLVVGNALRLAR